jgi:hypothetical protein
MLCAYIANPYAAIAQPVNPHDSGKLPIQKQIGRYQMVYHWNHLDWNFSDTKMKQQFEANQDWKKAMPAGVKVDQQGNYYVSVPR